MLELTDYTLYNNVRAIMEKMESFENKLSGLEKDIAEIKKLMCNTTNEIKEENDNA